MQDVQTIAFIYRAFRSQSGRPFGLAPLNQTRSQVFQLVPPAEQPARPALACADRAEAPPGRSRLFRATLAS